MNLKEEQQPEVSWRHVLILVVASVIWGFSYVSRSVGMTHMGPFAFNSIRMLMASIVLLPYVFYRRRRRDYERSDGIPAYKTKTLLRAGLICGVALFLGVNLQQVALLHAEIGKVSFITTLYIIAVPILGIAFRKRTPPSIWIALALAVIGFYFLSVTQGSGVAKGDLIALSSVLFFAIHILAIDRYSHLVDPFSLSSLQFFVVGLLTGLLAIFFETTTWAGVTASVRPLLFSGVISIGIGFTMQVIGQKGVPPAFAALIMSQEATFSVLFGWIFLREVLNPRQMLGCAFMLLGIMAAEVLPMLRKRLVKVSETR